MMRATWRWALGARRWACGHSRRLAAGDGSAVARMVRAPVAARLGWPPSAAGSVKPPRSPEPGAWSLKRTAPSLEPDEMKARVFVTLKPSVFDPQGRTITEALHQMGYAGVGDVRQGKYFELDDEATSPEHAHTLASEVAHKLLANPVIERYTVEIG